MGYEIELGSSIMSFEISRGEVVKLQHISKAASVGDSGRVTIN